MSQSGRTSVSFRNFYLGKHVGIYWINHNIYFSNNIYRELSGTKLGSVQSLSHVRLSKVLSDGVYYYPILHMCKWRL